MSAQSVSAAVGAEDALAATVERAKGGGPAALEALEALVAALQDRVYGLAIRMLGDPDDAQDATQEILVKVVTHLDSYRGESAFATWVYRVASNYLLTARKRRAEQRAEQMGLSFDGLEQMLQQGLALAVTQKEPAPEDPLLEEEVKLGCTQSMLLCLDREHRLAFILADVLGLTGEEGAYVLEIAPPAFRKRLSRARKRLRAFMTRQCGLVNPESACRCAKQIPFALHAGMVDPAHLRFATHPAYPAQPAHDGRPSPRAAAGHAVKHAVQNRMRELEVLEDITAVFRSHPSYAAPAAFAAAMKNLIASGKFAVLNA